MSDAMASDAGLEDLVLAALGARDGAYAPYSGFRVGAAVLTEGGDIFVGANVENASYGLTVCAERVAIFSAISSGARRLSALAVASEGGVFPCGACLQVFAEFASPDAVVVAVDAKSKLAQKAKLGELLPKAFRLTYGNGSS